MPKLIDVPAALRPYVFHGMSFELRGGEAVSDCPFCGREGKFSVKTEGDGLWRCLVCAGGSSKGGGNVLTFLRLLHGASLPATTPADYDALAADRGLLDPDTLVVWGLARSILTGEWLLPGYGEDGKLKNLYRCAEMGSGRKLLSTPGQNQTIFGLDLYDSEREYVYVCEGPWDGMALWETMRAAKWGPGVRELMETGSEESCLLASASVVAAPGCGSFPDRWGCLFGGRAVVLLYDNDHPRRVCSSCKKDWFGIETREGAREGGKHLCPDCGKPLSGETEPAGYAGMKRAAGVLAAAERPPASLSIIEWGDGGYTLTLPGGYDVRDMLTASDDVSDRLLALESLLSRVKPVPADWCPGRSPGAVAAGSLTLEPLPCDSWKVLVNAWRKALKWTEGLDRALSAMLACVASTGHAGDQLWLKVMSPASTGKSKLCEALSVARKWVEPWSSIRGFHSGVKSDRDGSEDNSLIVRLAGKTLVTKDGDTLLTTPNRDQVLSEARDLYDRVSRAHYRHGLNRRYENLSITWVLCGTGSLRLLDASELGERFLSCYIMEDIDPELERDIGRRSAYHVFNSFGTMVNGDPETSDTPEMIQAKRLTAGYVCHLRENAATLMRAVRTSMTAEEAKGVVERCVEMGTFVSHARARPSKKQDEVVEREMSARLSNQLTLLAGCMAVVLNRDGIDDEVMRRVRQIALDTARGRVLGIVRYLYRHGEAGADAVAVAIISADTEEHQRPLLRFLSRIGALESFAPGESKVVRSVRKRWRLTGRMRELYESVYLGDGGGVAE